MGDEIKMKNATQPDRAESQRTNKEYKDSVFRKLFNNEKNIIELYNAIEDTQHKEDTEVIIRTLDGALYFYQKNDLAFQIDKKFVVICEHQSSINPNMPLRIYSYLAEVYDKIVGKEAIYGETLVKIPTPKFYVLYNGKKKYPAETVLKLSDAFEECESKSSLELEVKVININLEQHHRVLTASPTLNGYSVLIDIIRSNENKGMSRDEAINEAISKCVRSGILTDFLKNNWREVFNMLHSQYNYEDDIAVKTREAMEKAIKIMKMLSKGKPTEEIAALLRTSQEEVEDIKKELEQEYQ